MSRMKEFPRYHVMSFRITDEELQELTRLKKKYKTSYSDLIREALSTTDCPVGGRRDASLSK